MKILILVVIFTVANAQQIRQDLLNHPHYHLIDTMEDCGYSMTNRIIGGINASLGQYPWIARLMYEGKAIRETRTPFLCGGTIISNRYILSAAHCCKYEADTAQLMSVRLGEYNMETDLDCVGAKCAPPVQDIDVEAYKYHEDYKDETIHNDICLIRLAQPIQFNEFVAPICLPVYDSFSSKLTNAVMEVAGWGYYEIDSKYFKAPQDRTSTTLQTLKVNITTLSHCAEAYELISLLLELIDSQICAGGVIGQDSCQGDSGGPLMTPLSFNSPPRYFLVGITSYGAERCAVTATPGIYTNVSHFMDWILDNIMS